MEENREIKKPKVLLVGPGLNVKGGITTVLNSYLDSELAEKVEFGFVPTREDGSKIKKLFVAIKGYFLFLKLVNEYDIVHIHISDHTENADCLPPGKGDFDFARLIGIMNSAGYNGDYIIELYRENFGDENDLKQSLLYMQNL